MDEIAQKIREIPGVAWVSNKDGFIHFCFNTASGSQRYGSVTKDSFVLSGWEGANAERFEMSQKLRKIVFNEEPRFFA